MRALSPRSFEPTVLEQLLLLQQLLVLLLQLLALLQGQAPLEHPQKLAQLLPQLPRPAPLLLRLAQQQSGRIRSHQDLVLHPLASRIRATKTNL